VAKIRKSQSQLTAAERLELPMFVLASEIPALNAMR